MAKSKKTTSKRTAVKAGSAGRKTASKVANEGTAGADLDLTQEDSDRQPSAGAAPSSPPEASDAPQPIGPASPSQDKLPSDSGSFKVVYEPPGDAVYTATLLECRERGMNIREAESFADDVCDRLRMVAGDAPSDAPGPALLDLRHKQDYIYPGGKRKAKTVDRQNRVPFMRKPSDVNAIVIHQTACEFGVSKRAVRLHGDPETARAHRALDVACHVLAFRNGYYVAAHDLRVQVNHAGRLNDRSLGLEIEGRYPGLMDDPGTVPREDLDTTWGGPPTELTDRTVETACAALKWMVEEAARYGAEIEYVYAHRQSSDSRRSDPGEEIWQRVVLEYAVPVLGLKTRPERALGKGRRIPVVWDADNGMGEY